MTTAIVEDVAVAAVIVLFAWLVPARRNGIPGLSGRGRLPAGLAPELVRPRPERVRPRAVPVVERMGAGRDREREARLLAELDRTWPIGYADRVATEINDVTDG
jgi:hypothetical protein